MDRGPFGATPRLRRRRVARRRVQSGGTGGVWTAPPHPSLCGPVRDRYENLDVRVFAPAKPECVGGPAP